MLSIPAPLHPAVVHFPVALLLVGCFLVCMGELSKVVDNLLDELAEAGETVRTLGVDAAGLAIVSELLGKWVVVSRVVADVSSIVSLAAGRQVAMVGHYGGRMVYQQWVGIREVHGANRVGVWISELGRGGNESDHD